MKKTSYQQILSFKQKYLNKIVNGNSLKLLKTFPSYSVDLVITDPPYGDNGVYGKEKTKIIGNENPTTTLNSIFEIYRVLKRNSVAYIFFAIKHYSLIEKFILGYTKFKIRDVLIWDKVNHGRGFGFRYRYEAIFVLEKGKPKYNQRGTPNLLTISKIYNPHHPHEKPQKLIDILVQQSSRKKDIILDPFAGSGAILKAAKRLQRNFIGIEIDFNYYQIAKKRLAI